MSKGNQVIAFEMTPRQVWLIVGWGLVMLVVVLSLAPKPIELPIQAGDKFSHLLAYFVLMSWFSNIYQGVASRSGFAIGFLTLGVVLEYLQLWTGYRSFEVKDMLSGFAGIALALIFAPPRLPNYLNHSEEFYNYIRNRMK